MWGVVSLNLPVVWMIVVLALGGLILTRAESWWDQ